MAAIQVLYEDPYLVSAVKPAGMPAQPDRTGQTDLLSLLGICRPGLGLVHRLDTPTGGVMIFGKTKAATAALSALVQNHQALVKEYLCVLPTAPESKEGILTDFLYHDAKANKTFPVPPPREGEVPRRGVRQARLSYRVLYTLPVGDTQCTLPPRGALVLVRLFTGRTHQVRAQFAARGLPLWGDGKYGSRVRSASLALWSFRMAFTHPITGKPVCLSCLPDTAVPPWSFFSEAWPNMPGCS